MFKHFLMKIKKNSGKIKHSKITINNYDKTIELKKQLTTT